MTALPEWMRPPRMVGWYAEDLDHLPEVPRHTELIDGALVFRMLPQRVWHSLVVSVLERALRAGAPEGMSALREITVRLDNRNRPEPDVVVVTVPIGFDRTWYAPDEVALAIEVVSPESAHRARTVKLRKYAEAGIPHYWRIEEEDHLPVVHVYELDEATGSYAPAGIFRGKLERPVPFPLAIDLDGLIRVR